MNLDARPEPRDGWSTAREPSTRPGRDTNRARNEVILRQVAEGARYADVASRFGISASRVGQLVRASWRRGRSQSPAHGIERLSESSSDPKRSAAPAETSPLPLPAWDSAQEHVEGPSTAPVRPPLDHLFGGAGEIIFRFRIDPPGMEYVNDAVERILGVPASAFYAAPELAARLAGHVPFGPRAALGLEPELMPTTSRWLRPDGQSVLLETRVVPVVDEHARLVALEGIARDASAEAEALQEHRELLDALLGSAPVVLWALDREGRVKVARGAGLPALGASPERLVGRLIGEVVPDMRRILRHFERVLRGERIAIDVAVGERIFATVAGPTRDASGEISGAIGVSTDVTHVRHLETRQRAEARERAAVRKALERLDPDLGLDALADTTASELLRVEGIARADVLGFGPRGLVYVLGTAGRAVPGLERGGLLPEARARYLRARARQGPWLQAWEPRPIDGLYGLALAAAGISAVAYQPLRLGRETVGLLVLASSEWDGVAALERRLTTLAEAASAASAVLAPALRSRAKDEHVRAEIAAAIESRRFHPVFQPIVALEDGRTVGYEALTRFHDGTPPERRFAEAANVALSIDLESATIAAAITAARGLPASLPLMLNVSPSLLLETERLERLLADRDRPVTLELTEREPIDDYPAIRAAMARLAQFRLSVDDAGAGYASLLHCIELRPQSIKLDRSLVNGVDVDPTRVAVIAGLLSLAEAMGSDLIAEGVETEAERAALLRAGVRSGQGYLFGVPAPTPGSPSD